MPTRPLVSVSFRVRDNLYTPVSVQLKFNPNGRRNAIETITSSFHGQVTVTRFKKCPVCKETYNLNEYTIDNGRWDGRAYMCVSCTKESTEKKKKRISDRRGTDEGYEFETTEDGEKGIRCKTCNTVKGLSEYHRNSHSLSGYRPSCKHCTINHRSN